MKDLRKVYLPTDFRVFMSLYAGRILWWSIGGSLGMDFAVSYLDYLRTPFSSVFMFIVGIMGALGAWKQYYWLSYLSALMSVFMFGLFSYSFFLNNSNSVAGGNYFLEMLGAVYIAIRMRTLPLQVSSNLSDYGGPMPDSVKYSHLN